MIHSTTKKALGLTLLVAFVAATLMLGQADAAGKRQRYEFKLPMHALTVYTIEVEANVPLSEALTSPPAADGSVSGFVFAPGPIQVKTDPTTGRQVTTYTVKTRFLPQSDKSGLYTLSISPRDADKVIINYGWSFKSAATY